MCCVAVLFILAFFFTITFDDYLFAITQYKSRKMSVEDGKARTYNDWEKLILQTKEKNLSCPSLGGLKRNAPTLSDPCRDIGVICGQNTHYVILQEEDIEHKSNNDDDPLYNLVLIVDTRAMTVTLNKLSDAKKPVVSLYSQEFQANYCRVTFMVTFEDKPTYGFMFRPDPM